MAMNAAPLTPPGSWLHRVLFNETGMRAGTRLAIFLPLWWILRDRTVRGLSRLIFIHLFPPGSVNFGQHIAITPAVTFVFPCLEFLVLLLACWIMSKIERRDTGSYGLPWKMDAWRSLYTGAGLSLVALASLIFTIYLFHGIEFSGMETHGAEALKYGIFWAITFLMVGFAEEYMFRGYMLTTLTEGIHFWPAAILLSFCFALVHTGNPGENNMGLFSVMIAGLVFAYLVKVTGNLWFAVGFHAGWDWAQSFLFGVPDSGLVSIGRWLIPVIHGPDWLSGGSAGPEGSVFCPIIQFVCAIVVGRFYSQKNINQKATETSSI